MDQRPNSDRHEPQRYLAMARQHYENFPVGSWLLPKAARLHLHRVYAFARTADDLADELRDRAGLAAFRADFLAHVRGERADVPLFVDLCATLRACELPLAHFTDLLDAFAQDLDRTRYDEPALLDYCRRSANPVGRIVLAVSGYRAPALALLSDRICTALQLLNHLQDLQADLRERNRVYFPAADLARFGVQEQDLLAAQAGPELRALVAHWCARLTADFAAGWELTRNVRGRLRLELRAILRGAFAVLARMRKVQGDVLAGRVHLSKRERCVVLLQAVLWPHAPKPGVWP